MHTRRFVGLLVAAAACSSSAPPAAGQADASFLDGREPNVSLVSDSGSLRLALRTDPYPPARGTCTVALTITDSSGTPQDDLTVDLLAGRIPRTPRGKVLGCALQR